MVEAADHARAQCARLAGAGIVQRPPAGKLTEFGGQGYATIDFPGPPTGDVQQQPIQRPAYERGLGLVRERPLVGVVVVTAVDPATQQMLIAVHPSSLPATTGNAGWSGAAQARPCAQAHAGAGLRRSP
ncbi:hypothetical protein SANTM175S_04136 [Streptomyces antimycoticus]